MSQQAHFWLRIVGLSVIMVLEFGPRIGIGCTVTSPARMAAAATAR